MIEAPVLNVNGCVDAKCSPSLDKRVIEQSQPMSVESLPNLDITKSCAEGAFTECYEKGLFLHHQGLLDEAIHLYHQAIAIQPNSSTIYFQLGLALDQQGYLEKAVQSYRQAISLRPSYLSAHGNLGCALLKQGKIDAAIQSLEWAIAHYPGRAFLYNNLGRALQSDNQIDRAMIAYQEAIRLQPDLVESHLNVGCLLQQRGQTEEAIACLHRVVELDPCHSEAHSRLGQWFLDQGQLEPAMACWQQCLVLQPDFAAAYCDRAQVKVKQLQQGDELDHIQLICSEFLMTLWHDAQHPALPKQLSKIYGYLGKMMLGYGALEQAETYYRKALQIRPQPLNVWLNLGDCLTRQRRLDVAIAIYYLALQHYPKTPSLYRHIGHALEQQNRPQQAIAAYQNALHYSSSLSSYSSTSSTPNASGNVSCFWNVKGDTLPRVLPPSASFSNAPTPSPPTHLYLSTQAWANQTTLKGVRYVDVHVVTSATPHTLPSSHPIPLDPPTTHDSNLCGGVTCIPCMTKLRLEFEPIQLCDDVFCCSPTTPVEVEPCSTFVVTLPQGRAWIAPQKNSWMICNSMAIITPDHALLADLSRDYPWYLPGCDRHNPQNHELFRRDALPPLEHIEGRVAVLSGLSGHVYYHWMVDILPRLELLRQGGIAWQDIDYFVVNSISQPFQRDTLKRLGIPLEKVIVSDRHPHIQAEQLIIPSFPGHLDWVPAETVNFLRQTFLHHVWSDAEQAAHSASGLSRATWPERIYISRSQARYRQVINESEVMDQLRPLGFVPIVLESLSIEQQVALFAHARVIVAPHGGGLTNTMFCQPGTHIVELVSPHYMRTDYWIISHRLGLHHYVIRGEPFDCAPLRHLMYQNPLTEDICVPITALQSLIHHLKWT